MKEEELFKKLAAKTRTFFQQQGFDQAVFGLSGGADSSFLALVLSKALKPENVYALAMPEKGVTSEEDVEDAKFLCQKLGINFVLQPIGRMVSLLENLNWKQNKLAQMNNKARIRMTLLYNFANSQHALVAGTTNKSELLLGYGTKHGDAAADVMPLAGIYKSDLIKVAEKIGLPKNILKKKPSAGLFKGQTDEADLGAPYHKIDRFLKEWEKGRTEKSLQKKFGKRLTEKLLARIEANKHKRKLPPIIKVKV